MQKRNLKERFHYHAPYKEILKSLVVMLFLLFTTSFFFNQGVWMQERILPQTSWFEYTSIETVTTGFKKGEKLTFVSTMEYHRDMNIKWQDTLHCRQDGTVEKYKTQNWPEDGSTEFKEAGETVNLGGSGDINTWSYTAQPLSPKATECYMIYVAIGITPEYKVPKVYREKGDWFKVNQ